MAISRNDYEYQRMMHEKMMYEQMRGMSPYGGYSDDPKPAPSKPKPPSYLNPKLLLTKGSK